MTDITQMLNARMSTMQQSSQNSYDNLDSTLSSNIQRKFVFFFFFFFLSGLLLRTATLY